MLWPKACLSEMFLFADEEELIYFFSIFFLEASLDFHVYFDNCTEASGANLLVAFEGICLAKLQFE